MKVRHRTALAATAPAGGEAISATTGIMVRAIAIDFDRIAGVRARMRERWVSRLTQ